MAQVVEGIAKGCQLSGCSLLGGETAEMPGFYSKGRYDLAGFCVAVVEEANLIDGSGIQIGDQIIGVASSGIHSNGFSLVRKVLASRQISEKSVFGSADLPLIDTLLKPTTLYGRLVKDLLIDEVPLHGMAHITGGGLPENLPRCMPKGLQVLLDITTWERPEIFKWLQKVGNIPESDLWNTFNLGVGFCIVVPPAVANAALEVCSANGFEAWTIGQIQESIEPDSAGIMGLPY